MALFGGNNITFNSKKKKEVITLHVSHRCVPEL